MAGYPEPGVIYLTGPKIRDSWAVAHNLITNYLKKPDRNVEGYSNYERAREATRRLCFDLDIFASLTESYVINALGLLQLDKEIQEALETRFDFLDEILNALFSGQTRKQRASCSR